MGEIQTYPEMNDQIVPILRLSNNPAVCYAAQRIEELENSLAYCNSECEAAMERVVELERQLREARDQIEAIKQDWFSPAEVEGLQRRADDAF